MWLDDETLQIRNRESVIANADQSMRLNIFKAIYDERGRACRSFAMKDEYETAIRGKMPRTFMD
ncbi:MAG: hypothetical protein C6P37_03090 [Caldibacillus debilis]|uniref:Uncharacterized protein n=1 Tax=Caldibacillus debilis TaxID=301148 RepID=A0A3E0K737_9BACI|nr:MAG: hypothetical protein BAA03_04855 [Caldibacillus debilis]REJ30449.1 MAG: hypothetical protein C6P37_03090 [Caldibacillus debilis]